MKKSFSNILAVFEINFLAWLFSFLGYDNTVRFTKFLFPIIRLIYRDKYKIFYKNHSVVNKNLSGDVLQSLANSSMKSMFINYALCLRYSRVSVQSDKQHFDIPDLQNYRDILTRQPIIFLTVHLGPSLFIIKYISEVLKNPIILPVRNYSDLSVNKFLEKYDSNFLKLVFLGQTMSEIDKVLSQNGVLVMPLDVVVDSKYKTEVKFFGQDFNMINSILWLRQKYNAKIIPILGTFDNNYNVKVEIFEELVPESTNPMQEIADKVEEMIRKYPGNWALPEDYFN